MNRSAKAALAFVCTAVVATVAARPALAEPDPIELDRLPFTPVQIWRDVNANGSHDFGDLLLATTYTDPNGFWQVSGLPTNPTSRLIVIKLLEPYKSTRVGGDLFRNSSTGFDPIDGVRVSRRSDNHSPFTYFDDGDNLVVSDTTHCVEEFYCGDFRLLGTNTTDAQGIVIPLTGTPASYGGYHGFLWDATLDDD
ncbi:MAG: hypothetical protein ABI780_05720 [Ardenticatenales bacterium]